MEARPSLQSALRRPRSAAARCAGARQSQPCDGDVHRIAARTRHAASRNAADAETADAEIANAEAAEPAEGDGAAGAEELSASGDALRAEEGGRHEPADKPARSTVRSVVSRTASVCAATACGEWRPAVVRDVAHFDARRARHGRPRRAAGSARRRRKCAANATRRCAAGGTGRGRVCANAVRRISSTASTASTSTAEEAAAASMTRHSHTFCCCYPFCCSWGEGIVVLKGLIFCCLNVLGLTKFLLLDPHLFIYFSVVHLRL